MNMKFVFSTCFAFLFALVFSARSFATARIGGDDSLHISGKKVDLSGTDSASCNCGGFITINYSNQSGGTPNTITQIKVVSDASTQPLIFNNPTNFPIASGAPVGNNVTITITFSPRSTGYGTAVLTNDNTDEVMSFSCYHAPESVIIPTSIYCQPHLTLTITDTGVPCDY